MPRDGTKNLTPLNKQTKEKQKEITRLGGIKSGEVRRQKRDLRKALQLALDNTYTDTNGDKISAVDAMARNLVAKAVSSRNKDAMAAIKYICELTGMNKTPEQTQREEIELDLMKQELELKKQVAKDMQEGSDNEIKIEIVRAPKKSKEDDE